MATRINLLPWREMRRKEQDRQLLSIGIFTWMLMGLIVFYGHYQVSKMIQTQQNRNKYLQSEIGKLDKKLRKIKDIKKQRAALVARMDVIYKLQSDRTRMVHIMDELVRTLPEGVYYWSMVQRGDRLILNGAAQSNARIAALYRNLDKSPWFSNPDLKVVNVVRRGTARVSNFDLTVKQLEQPKTADTDKDKGDKNATAKKPGGKRS